MEAQPFVREVVPLEPLIREVVQARNLLVRLRAALAVSRQEWDMENEVLLKDTATTQEILAFAETNLRGEALANYAATGNKQVAPGIVIHVTHRAVYEVKAASEWSKAHGGIAHVFDAKLFEKLAQAGQASDIVTIEDVPIATLSKDLATLSKE